MALPPPQPITSPQIKKIHTLLHRFKISDQAYRELLKTHFSVDSCKALNVKQAAFLIELLEAWQTGQNRATPRQLRKINALWDDVSRAPEGPERKKALRSFTKRQTGCDDVVMVPRDQINAIICSLVAMARDKAAIMQAPACQKGY